MNYTLNQLRIFLKIVEQKSITRAADLLFLTQPAVSIQLKNFQDQFDIPLTEVINKKLYVTDFGYEIAEAAKLILDEVDSMQYKKAMYQGKLTGKIKMAVVSTGKYIAPFLINDFLKQNPEVELILDVSNRDSVIRNLEKNEVDFVLMSLLPENIAMEHVELMPNRLFLVGSKNSMEEFTKNKKQFFEKTPFIFREFGSATRKVMDQYLSEQGIAAEKNITLTSNEAVKQAVISGMGCSIMPLIGIKNELQLGQLEILKAPKLPIQSKWYLVNLRDKKHLPAAKVFKEYLQQNMEEIKSKYFNWDQNFVK
jgi:DNA-binding transcriptional LysR family regulator